MNGLLVVMAFGPLLGLWPSSSFVLLRDHGSRRNISENVQFPAKIQHAPKSRTKSKTVKFGCQVAGQYMNHPEEFTKITPNHIVKWVLKERQHSPHAQLLLVLEQIKSSSPSMGCSRVLKLQNLLMQTSLTIFLQTKVRGAARIIISWAFKNSSNITPRLLPLAGNSNIDNTCFSCHPWRFFLFFLVFRSKNTLQQRLDPKTLAQVLSCLSI